MLLVRGYTTQKDFCAEAGIEPSYLSQLKGGQKQFGSELARKIEERLGKSRGWLDVQNGAPEPKEDHGLLALSHAVRSLPPTIRNPLSALIFEMARLHMMHAEDIQPFDFKESLDGQTVEIPAARRRRGDADND